ncbi:MAG: AMP-binding protein, partial [Muribaculaceae bacterium]|nr:AMP-binding protein [Muribaculaceae bacterium]
MTQEEFERIWHDSNDYVECHTSGSTGEPKEIRLPKEYMRSSARRTNRFFGVDSSSRLHTCLDFKYIASMMMTVRADEAGCRLTSEHPSSRPLGNIGRDERIDLLSLVPAQMEWLLDSAEKWNGIRNILVGGSAIPAIMRRRIILSDYCVWETYGMTETSSHIALRKVDNEDVPFTTLEGISIELNDEGCLVVHMPDGTCLTTTDLAELTGYNQFRILGRADHTIISGGIKIMPEELERRLGPFIAFDYCVSSVPDKKWGEKLVIAVEAPQLEIDSDLLRKAVEVRLRQYRKILELGVKSPKDVLVVSSLPRTSNGKIDRNKLKKNLYE